MQDEKDRFVADNWDVCLRRAESAWFGRLLDGDLDVYKRQVDTGQNADQGDADLNGRKKYVWVVG